MSLDSDILKTETAFKHPQCGGLIWMLEGEKRIFFLCDTCLETAEHLEQLAIGKPVILRRRRRNDPKKLELPKLEG